MDYFLWIIIGVIVGTYVGDGVYAEPELGASLGGLLAIATGAIAIVIQENARSNRFVKRALCCFGVHWKGASGMGCMYDIKHCDICDHDVDGLIVHDWNKT